ncbi:MAG: hypothetical protein M1829_003939 [Trizodia sp. TS-e1964]|nr:MAG: hypothetical protein M1829_003939 [Trizodia sp. TS-e1964]
MSEPSGPAWQRGEKRKRTFSPPPGVSYGLSDRFFEGSSSDEDEDDDRQAKKSKIAPVESRPAYRLPPFRPITRPVKKALPFKRKRLPRDFIYFNPETKQMEKKPATAEMMDAYEAELRNNWTPEQKARAAEKEAKAEAARAAEAREEARYEVVYCSAFTEPPYVPIPGEDPRRARPYKGSQARTESEKRQMEGHLERINMFDFASCPSIFDKPFIPNKGFSLNYDEFSDSGSDEEAPVHEDSGKPSASTAAPEGSSEHNGIKKTKKTLFGDSEVSTAQSTALESPQKPTVIKEIKKSLFGDSEVSTEVTTAQPPASEEIIKQHTGINENKNALFGDSEVSKAQSPAPEESSGQHTGTKETTKALFGGFEVSTAPTPAPQGIIEQHTGIKENTKSLFGGSEISTAQFTATESPQALTSAPLFGQITAPKSPPIAPLFGNTPAPKNIFSASLFGQAHGATDSPGKDSLAPLATPEKPANSADGIPTWTQPPPPRPVPSHAFLPLQSPIESSSEALAKQRSQAEKYKPKQPSRLNQASGFSNSLFTPNDPNSTHKEAAANGNDNMMVDDDVYTKESPKSPTKPTSWPGLTNGSQPAQTTLFGGAATPTSFNFAQSSNTANAANAGLPVQTQPNIFSGGAKSSGFKFPPSSNTASGGSPVQNPPIIFGGSAKSSGFNFAQSSNTASGGLPAQNPPLLFGGSANSSGFNFAKSSNTGSGDSPVQTPPIIFGGSANSSSFNFAKSSSTASGDPTVQNTPIIFGGSENSSSFNNFTQTTFANTAISPLTQNPPQTAFGGSANDSSFNFTQTTSAKTATSSSTQNPPQPAFGGANNTPISFNFGSTPSRIPTNIPASSSWAPWSNAENANSNAAVPQFDFQFNASKSTANHDEITGSKRKIKPLRQSGSSKFSRTQFKGSSAPRNPPVQSSFNSNSQQNAPNAGTFVPNQSFTFGSSANGDSKSEQPAAFNVGPMPGVFTFGSNNQATSPAPLENPWPLPSQGTVNASEVEVAQPTSPMRFDFNMKVDPTSPTGQVPSWPGFTPNSGETVSKALTQPVFGKDHKPIFNLDFLPRDKPESSAPSEHVFQWPGSASSFSAAAVSTVVPAKFPFAVDNKKAVEFDFNSSTFENPKTAGFGAPNITWPTSNGFETGKDSQKPKISFPSLNFGTTTTPAQPFPFPSVAKDVAMVKASTPSAVSEVPVDVKYPELTQGIVNSEDEGVINDQKSLVSTIPIDGKRESEGSFSLGDNSQLNGEDTRENISKITDPTSEEISSPGSQATEKGVAGHTASFSRSGNQTEIDLATPKPIVDKDAPAHPNQQTTGTEPAVNTYPANVDIQGWMSKVTEQAHSPSNASSSGRDEAKLDEGSSQTKRDTSLTLYKDASVDISAGEPLPELTKQSRKRKASPELTRVTPEKKSKIQKQHEKDQIWCSTTPVTPPLLTSGLSQSPDPSPLSASITTPCKQKRIEDQKEPPLLNMTRKRKASDAKPPSESQLAPKRTKIIPTRKNKLLLDKVADPKILAASQRSNYAGGSFKNGFNIHKVSSQLKGSTRASGQPTSAL